MRAIRLLVGLLLLPVCAAITLGTGRWLLAVRPPAGAEASLPAWAAAIGLALWFVLYATVPPSTRSYVLAHELTHALWGLAMGARVGRIRASETGGSTALSKTNFLIILAPYFFPFYSILLVASWYGLALFWDLSVYRPFWAGLVGLAWGFHLTYTATSLMQHQSDIALCGRLFSYTVIYILNWIAMAVILALVISASPLAWAAAQLHALAEVGAWVSRELIDAAQYLAGLIRHSVR